MISSSALRKDCSTKNTLPDMLTAAAKLMKSTPTEQQRTKKKLNFKGLCEVMQTFKEEALGSGVTSSGLHARVRANQKGVDGGLSTMGRWLWAWA